MSYYSYMYGVNICKSDLNDCLLRAKPLCLTHLINMHRCNCLYE